MVSKCSDEIFCIEQIGGRRIDKVCCVLRSSAVCACESKHPHSAKVRIPHDVSVEITKQVCTPYSVHLAI